MDEGLTAILRLVGEGRLSAAEAEPLVAALMAAGDAPGSRPAAPTEDEAESGGSPDHVRLTVTERGRTVINLRVPVALGRVAVGLVPGLSASDSSRLEAAVSAGRRGPLLDISDDDGDGVRVVLE